MRWMRRLSAIFPTFVPIALASAVPTAGAAEVHTVQPGDTLWSIAAANNYTTRTLAAYNGLPEDGHVVLGSTIRVPSPVEGAAALTRAGITPGAPSAVTGGQRPAAAPASSPASRGGYLVRPGDTLSALAASSGVRVSELAARNGLDPARPLIAGTRITLPNSGVAAARATTPAPKAAPATSSAPAQKPATAAPAASRVQASEIQRVAQEYGVSPSLASAIAWQESGFNNAAVSSANAKGVMQVIPRTWSWVQTNLAKRPLDPSSATDNVHAGVLYLKHLLEYTGGDEQSAIASYYQGPRSVRHRGMYDDTKKYVSNVQALKSRFGG
jgi:soluble lytic murein transglycosylase-like protein